MRTTLLITHICGLPWGDRALPIPQASSIPTCKLLTVVTHRWRPGRQVRGYSQVRGLCAPKLTVTAFRYQKDLTTLHAVLWDNGAKFPFSQVSLTAQYQLLLRGSTAPLRVQTNGKFNGFPKFPITNKTRHGNNYFYMKELFIWKMRREGLANCAGIIAISEPLHHVISYNFLK